MNFDAVTMQGNTCPICRQSRVNPRINDLQAHFLRMGRHKAVIVTTLASILLSALLTALIKPAIAGSAADSTSLAVAILVPAIVAPLVSHWAWTLLYQIEATRQQLELAVIRDDMTGMFNRRHFIAMLEQELHRARRNRLPLSILLFDLDHFKQVNDTHGHAAGDAALAAIGKLLNEQVRPYDVAARHGGEEFAVLMPGLDKQNSTATAERLRQLIETLPITLPDETGTTIRLTASFGVASLIDDNDDTRKMLHRADIGLYAAKSAGRNRVGTAEA
ncbi:MAG: GGDEF domain-containing protein [Pseudomonadota bacterium]|nr:GGDEF domain-containing protein [Pseudomonadota bacterium]